jgi:DNA polymerase-3 subunit gamma/tau
MGEATLSKELLPDANNRYQKTTMQAQNFVQLELPVISQKVDPLKQIETAIQDMLTLTWQNVLAHISMRATKALMREHGKLIALSNGEARIRVSSHSLYKIAQAKLPEIEAGFQKAFGVRVKVHLEV